MAAQQERRQDEAVLEPIEEQAIAVRAHHAREVMANRAERSDEQIDLLWPESTLGQPQRGENDGRCAHNEDEVAPRIKNPPRAEPGRRGQPDRRG